MFVVLVNRVVSVRQKYPAAKLNAQPELAARGPENVVGYEISGPWPLIGMAHHAAMRAMATPTCLSAEVLDEEQLAVLELKDQHMLKHVIEGFRGRHGWRDKNVLRWEQHHNHAEAILGHAGDGVRFTYCFQPTCYRRGPHKILIEVFGGEHHNKWGCFDDADQPVRYYHKNYVAKAEAELIAQVLLKDRLEHGPITEPVPDAE